MLRTLESAENIHGSRKDKDSEFKLSKIFLGVFFSI